MRFALLMRHVAYKIPFQSVSEQVLFDSQKYGPVSIIFWFYKCCDVKLMRATSVEGRNRLV
jgi:hypothetical protein